MSTVFLGYVKGCCKSLSCKSRFKLHTRGSLDYPKREATNGSLINPKIVVIATVKYHNTCKSTMKKSCSPRVFFGILSELEVGML